MVGFGKAKLDCFDVFMRTEMLEFKMDLCEEAFGVIKWIKDILDLISL